MNHNDLVMSYLGEIVEFGRYEHWVSPYHKVVMERDGEKVNVREEFFDEPLIAQNQKVRNEFNKNGSHGDFVEMAEFSQGAFFALQKQGRMDYDADIRKVLNDPQYAGYRTNDWKA
jgi:hypothetical protein